MDRKRGFTKITERTKVFSSLICRGKVRAAERYACVKEKRGILIPGDTYVKTGELVCDTLKLKHSQGRDIEVENLPLFDSCRALIQIEVANENVELVAKRICGSAGPSGINSISMSHWLLKFGGASAKLWKSIKKLIKWLTNGYPLWAAYREITCCILVSLDKSPSEIIVQNSVGCRYKGRYTVAYVDKIFELKSRGVPRGYFFQPLTT